VERFELAVKNARDAIEELRLASYERGYKDAVRDINQVAPTETPKWKVGDKLMVMNANAIQIDEGDDLYDGEIYDVVSVNFEGMPAVNTTFGGKYHLTSREVAYVKRIEDGNR
jgi:hypothetical protein